MGHHREGDPDAGVIPMEGRESRVAGECARTIVLAVGIVAEESIRSEDEPKVFVIGSSDIEHRTDGVETEHGMLVAKVPGASDE